MWMIGCSLYIERVILSRGRKTVQQLRSSWSGTRDTSYCGICLAITRLRLCERASCGLSTHCLNSYAAL